jgi:hypothetical protein
MGIHEAIEIVKTLLHKNSSFSIYRKNEIGNRRGPEKSSYL